MDKITLNLHWSIICFTFFTKTNVHLNNYRKIIYRKGIEKLSFGGGNATEVKILGQDIADFPLFRIIKYIVEALGQRLQQYSVY